MLECAKEGVMTRIAKNITRLMVDESVVDEEDREYMSYAMELLLEKAISIASIILVAILANKFVESVLFLATFCTLRKYTGGFHFKRFGICYFASVFLYVLIMNISSVLCGAKYCGHIVYAFTTVSLFVILMIGTVNHPNMNLDDGEVCKSRNRARFGAVFICACITLLALVGIEMKVLIFPCFGVTLCAVLQILAKITGQEVKINERC